MRIKSFYIFLALQLNFLISKSYSKISSSYKRGKSSRSKLTSYEYHFENLEKIIINKPNSIKVNTIKARSKRILKGKSGGSPGGSGGSGGSSGGGSHGGGSGGSSSSHSGGSGGSGGSSSGGGGGSSYYSNTDDYAYSSNEYYDDYLYANDYTDDRPNSIAHSQSSNNHSDSHSSSSASSTVISTGYKSGFFVMLSACFVMFLFFLAMLIVKLVKNETDENQEKREPLTKAVTSSTIQNTSANVTSMKISEAAKNATVAAAAAKIPVAVAVSSNKIRSLHVYNFFSKHGDDNKELAHYYEKQPREATQVELR